MNGIKKDFSTIGSFMIFVLLPFFSLCGDARISGKVIEVESINPMRNIKVVLLGSSSLETTTDDKGIYQFLGVPSGKYKIQLEPPRGFVAVSTNPLTIDVESTPIKLNFSLGIPGNIIGSVIDSMTNLPVVNACVDIMQGNTVISSSFTDQNGIYKIRELAPRPHVVRVRMPSFQSCLQLATPIASQTIALNFTLRHLLSKITGQVVNVITEQPISNVTIDILDGDFIVDSVQSNEEGNYTISEITPSNYKVRINAPHFRIVNQDIILSANQLLSLHFALEPMGSVIGQVIHSFTGQPIAKANVEMWQNDVLFDSTHTDKSGYFTLDGLDECQLIVRFGEFYDQQESIHIHPMQTHVLNFNLICLEPSPPTKMNVKVSYKRFAHKVNRIHSIKWKASRDSSVTSYRIYRNQKIIGEVAAADSCVFKDEWRSNNETTYHVTALNAFGQESVSISYTISD